MKEEPREVKFTPEALASMADMSPEDMKEVGEMLERIAADPSSGRKLSKEEVQELVDAGTLPKSALNEEMYVGEVDES